MSDSIRFNIRRRRAQHGDLLIELVSDDLRHIKIEAKASADGGLDVGVAIFADAVDDGAQHKVELAGDKPSKKDVMDRDGINRWRINEDVRGGFNRNHFTQDQSSQIEKLKTDLSRGDQQQRFGRPA